MHTEPAAPVVVTLIYPFDGGQHRTGTHLGYKELNLFNDDPPSSSSNNTSHHQQQHDEKGREHDAPAGPKNVLLMCNVDHGTRYHDPARELQEDVHSPARPPRTRPGEPYMWNWVSVRDNTRRCFDWCSSSFPVRREPTHDEEQEEEEDIGKEAVKDPGTMMEEQRANAEVKHSQIAPFSNKDHLNDGATTTTTTRSSLCSCVSPNIVFGAGGCCDPCWTTTKKKKEYPDRFKERPPTPTRIVGLFGDHSMEGGFFLGNQTRVHCAWSGLERTSLRPSECHSRLFFFDAHGDSNTCHTSPSGNCHGMMLGQIVLGAEMLVGSNPLNSCGNIPPSLLETYPMHHGATTACPGRLPCSTTHAADDDKDETNRDGEGRGRRTACTAQTSPPRPTTDGEEPVVYSNGQHTVRLGVPMSYAGGNRPQELWLPQARILHPRHLCMIGTCSVDSEESVILHTFQSAGARLYSPEAIEHLGPKEVLKTELERLNLSQNFVHLSLDVDVTLGMQCTGTPEGTVPFGDVQHLLGGFVQTGRVVAAGMYEMNPLLRPQYLDGNRLMWQKYYEILKG